MARFEAGAEGGWSSLAAFPFHVSSLFSTRLRLSKSKRQEDPAGQDKGGPRLEFPHDLGSCTTWRAFKVDVPPKRTIDTDSWSLQLRKEPGFTWFLSDLKL